MSIRFSLITVFAIFATGCTPMPQDSNVPAEDSVPGEDDGARKTTDPTDRLVLDTVLHDLAEQDFGSYPGGKTVYVCRESLGESGFYHSDAQLASDLRDHEIPAGMVDSLRERNRDGAFLWPAGERSKNAVIGDFDSVTDWDFRREDFPDCKLIVKFWMPGYSKDGEHAMIRFSISPTAHGATGTYLLKRDGERWVVEWFEKSYYL